MINICNVLISAEIIFKQLFPVLIFLFYSYSRLRIFLPIFITRLQNMSFVYDHIGNVLISAEFIFKQLFPVLIFTLIAFVIFSYQFI